LQFKAGREGGKEKEVLGKNMDGMVQVGSGGGEGRWWSMAKSYRKDRKKRMRGVTFFVQRKVYKIAKREGKKKTMTAERRYITHVSSSTE